jgi:mRNA interferase RelE/StbE
MSYRIEIKRSAVKEIRRLSDTVLRRVTGTIGSLADDPRPKGCKKLSGSEKYRIWVGEYRIIYTIDDEAVTVYIVRVRHRRDVYR